MFKEQKSMAKGVDKAYIRFIQGASYLSSYMICRKADFFVQGSEFSGSQPFFVAAKGNSAFTGVQLGAFCS